MSTYTEEEAKVKFCPHQRAYNASGSNIWAKEGKQELTFVTCLGSRCMSWRWERIRLALEAGSVRSQEGYCGLAGRPE